MAGGDDAAVGSGSMEATPAFDATLPHPDPAAGGDQPPPHAPETLVEALEQEPTEAPPLSLASRLRQPRTILSIVVPLGIIGFFLYLNRERLAEVPQLILQANPALVLAAFLVFYAGFPLRGYRWSMLLRESGFVLSTRHSVEILYISWFVNCVVPAKLGDVYRGYLLKMNSPASLSRTLGTVFIERILDIFAIAIIALAAGYWSFRTGMSDIVRLLFIVGIVVVIVAAIGLFTMRNFGRRIITRLPLPHRALELYDRFEEGVFGAVGLRHLPRLAIITGLIWSTEGIRLYLVIASLGFKDVEIGLSGAMFVALIGSLLTAIPLSPAGLGFAQAGVIGVLTVVYGVPLPESTAITILDWVISVLSIIVLGAIVYVISPMPRGMGRIKQPPTTTPAQTAA
jgi:glycosyltransferase 2 family protein